MSRVCSTAKPVVLHKKDRRSLSSANRKQQLKETEMVIYLHTVYGYTNLNL